MWQATRRQSRQEVCRRQACGALCMRMCQQRKAQRARRQASATGPARRRKAPKLTGTALVKLDCRTPLRTRLVLVPAVGV